MENLDNSAINPNSTIGQVTVLIVAIVSLITAVGPILRSQKGLLSRRKYDTILDELKASKIELNFTRKINRNLVEWQISARELIRLLRNSLAEKGVETPERVSVLILFLEKIESENLYKELEEGPDD